MLGTLFSDETAGSSLLAFLIHFKPNNHQPSHMVSRILLTLFLFSCALTPPHTNSLIPNTDYHPISFYLLPPPGFHPLTSPLGFFQPEAVWSKHTMFVFPVLQIHATSISVTQLQTSTRTVLALIIGYSRQPWRIFTWRNGLLKPF